MTISHLRRAFFAPLAGWALLSGCTGVLGSTGSSGDDGDGSGGNRSDAGAWEGPEGEELIPEMPTEGTVPVTLHPDASVALGEPVIVSFGMPFPKGALSSPSLIRASANGEDLAVSSSLLAIWHPWPGSSDQESIRSVLVAVEVTFAELSPMEIEVTWGQESNTSVSAPVDPLDGWVAVTGTDYPSDVVTEPSVYATLPANWLSACLLRSRSTEAGSNSEWSWFDDAQIGFSQTAVNEVPDEVTGTIAFVDDFSPWLFDRTMTLYGTYVRTGDVAWLREGHRSAQFYRANLSSDGYFELKDSPDLKYSYGRSLFTNYLFTGDPALLPAIENIAEAGSNWNPTYDLGTNFWTERHQTYALLAALAAWEATGKASHATRVEQVARATFDMAKNPVGGWDNDGCTLHTMDSHEGAGGDTPICSPWMSALLADAVWQYYVQSQDPDALDFLANLAGFIHEHALYLGGESVDEVVPWYLVSSTFEFTDGGPWADFEHTCDVAGLMARGVWAARALDRDASEVLASTLTLVDSCKTTLDYWHRPNGPSSGQSEWRLSPARKYSWWFGTTSDMSWLLESLSAE